MQHATCNVRHATRSVQHAACNIGTFFGTSSDQDGLDLAYHMDVPSFSMKNNEARKSMLKLTY